MSMAASSDSSPVHHFVKCGLACLVRAVEGAKMLA
jgi:hypothetical protein